MPGQLCWKPLKGYENTDSRKILHWRLDPAYEWEPFWTHPGAVEAEKQGVNERSALQIDLIAKTGVIPQTDNLASHSLGYAAYQYLFKQGWKVVPASPAKMSV
jgi:hypothetical protein